MLCFLDLLFLYDVPLAQVSDITAYETKTQEYKIQVRNLEETSKNLHVFAKHWYIDQKITGLFPRLGSMVG